MSLGIYNMPRDNGETNQMLLTLSKRAKTWLFCKDTTLNSRYTYRWVHFGPNKVSINSPKVSVQVKLCLLISDVLVEVRTCKVLFGDLWNQDFQFLTKNDFLVSFDSSWTYDSIRLSVVTVAAILFCPDAFKDVFDAFSNMSRHANMYTRVLCVYYNM